MNIASICQRDIDTARLDETIQVAAERMRQRSVGTLVVIDAERKPVGIVTDRDLTIRILAPALDPAVTPVSYAMTELPHTVEKGASLRHVLRVMRDETCRRVPVVDAKGGILGIVTLDDVLMTLGRDMALISEVLERETPKAGAAS